MRERESKIKCESKHTNAYAQWGLEEMKDLRGSKIIIGWVPQRTNVNCPFQAAVVQRISRGYWKSTTFHGENAGAWNVLKMMTLMTGDRLAWILTWSKKVHFARSWWSWHSIPAWSHQRWCPKNFTPLALWQTTTNALSSFPYPMEDQIFKVIFWQFCLQIQFPCKKLREESVFLFCKFF